MPAFCPGKWSYISILCTTTYLSCSENSSR